MDEAKKKETGACTWLTRVKKSLENLAGKPSTPVTKSCLGRKSSLLP